MTVLMHRFVGTPEDEADLSRGRRDDPEKPPPLTPPADDTAGTHQMMEEVMASWQHYRRRQVLSLQALTWMR